MAPGAGRAAGPTCGAPLQATQGDCILRKSLPITALTAALFALGLAHPSIALPGLAPSTPAKAGKVKCGHVTAKAFRAFSARTWRMIAWERGAPPRKVIRAQRGKLKCAAGPRHRKAMRERWRADKRAYNAHRTRKLLRRKAQRERFRHLPYDCGGGVRSAIRCDIMWCESGGSYTAENPSGAYGKYQLMPEWWSHLGRKPTAGEQDRIASELWNGEAGRSNWVC